MTALVSEHAPAHSNIVDLTQSSHSFDIPNQISSDMPEPKKIQRRNTGGRLGSQSRLPSSVECMDQRHVYKSHRLYISTLVHAEIAEHRVQSSEEEWESCESLFMVP